MKFEKKILDEMKRCYCASNIEFDGVNHLLLASEDPNVACNMYWGENFENKQNVWTQPGGCMSIVPIPGKAKEFLAVQEFYLKVSPSLAKIVHGKYIDGIWVVNDVISLPYIHRFGIMQAKDNLYLIAATIAESKENKEDWSKAGKIYTAVLPNDLNQGVKLEVLEDGLFRNHGFWQTKINGNDVCFFGSDQGILKITLTQDGQFVKEHILDGNIGEIATVDIDQDGELEIMTIEPFHGNQINIYKNIAGKYQKVWTYDNEIDFAHTLVGATLANQPCFVAGVRRKNAELFVVTYENGEYKTTLVDKNVGPANICVVNETNRDIIVAANHTAAQATIYIVKED